MKLDRCQALACSTPAKTHDDETKEERRRGEEEKRKARERGAPGPRGGRVGSSRGLNEKSEGSECAVSVQQVQRWKAHR